MKKIGIDGKQESHITSTAGIHQIKKIRIKGKGVGLRKEKRERVRDEKDRLKEIRDKVRKKEYQKEKGGAKKKSR